MPSACSERRWHFLAWQLPGFAVVVVVGGGAGVVVVVGGGGRGAVVVGVVVEVDVDVEVVGTVLEDVTGGAPPKSCR